MKPEVVVLLINAAIVSATYFYIYPKFAGSDFDKITWNDLCATSIALMIAGSLFWGSEYAFDALLFSTNWFWFSLLSFFVMELPLLFWYVKKYNVDVNPESDQEL